MIRRAYTGLTISILVGLFSGAVACKSNRPSRDRDGGAEKDREHSGPGARTARSAPRADWPCRAVVSRGAVESVWLYDYDRSPDACRFPADDWTWGPGCPTRISMETEALNYQRYVHFQYHADGRRSHLEVSRDQEPSFDDSDRILYSEQDRVLEASGRKYSQRGAEIRVSDEFGDALVSLELERGGRVRLLKSELGGDQVVTTFQYDNRRLTGWTETWGPDHSVARFEYCEKL